MSFCIKYVYGPTKKDDKYIEILDTLDKVIFPADYLVDKKGSFWWVVTNGTEIIGFAGMRIIFGNIAIFLRAGIQEEYRGLGLHKRLIRARIRMAKKLNASQIVTYVARHNDDSSNNLIKNGFTIYSPQKEYGLKNAIYFQKNL